MKVDKGIHRIFSLVPKLLFEMLGIRVRGEYSYHSVAIKEFSRMMDGLMEPKEEGEPYYVVEFQNQLDRGIYHRIVMEMACLGVEHPERAYNGIIIFGEEKMDPRSEPWEDL